MHRLSETLLRALSRCQELRDRPSEERGQTLSEYGLLITIIAVGVVVLAAIAFRDQLAMAFESAASCVDGSC